MGPSHVHYWSPPAPTTQVAMTDDSIDVGMTCSHRNQYDPDYAVPVGWVLEERLDAQGMTRSELARRCGRSPELISEIILGKARLDPETALQFQKVLGVQASVWLGIARDSE